MKEIFCNFSDIHQELGNKVKDAFRNTFDVEFVENTEWSNKLSAHPNFTNELQISLFHQGFMENQSPELDQDPTSILFIKLHETYIFGDPTEEKYIHGFVGSWDTTKEPAIFLIKNCSRQEVDILVESLISKFPLILMG